jgi:hypothetical protein
MKLRKEKKSVLKWENVPVISNENRGRCITLFVGDLTAGSESAASLNTMVDALDLPANFPPTLTSVVVVCG